MNIKLWTVELTRIYLDGMETIILPSLTAIALYFMVPNYFVELMVPAYLGGKIFSKLIVLNGITIRHDKKKVLVSFLSLSIVGSLLALLPNPKWILLGRVIEGAGAGCITSISTAFVKQISQDDFLTSWSKINLVNVWVPLVATFLGGFVLSFLGWQYNFVFLVFLGLLTIYLVITVLPDSTLNLNPQNRVSSWLLFKDFPLLCEVIANSFIYGGQAVIYAITPILFLQHYHWPAKRYWIILLCFTVGLFIGNYIAKHFGRLLQKFSLKLSILSFIVVCALALIYVEHIPHLAVFFVLLIIGCYGLAQAIFTPLVQDDLQSKVPGLASVSAAMMGIFQSVIGTGLSLIAAIYFRHEPKDLGIILLGISITAFIIFLISYIFFKFQKTKN